MAYRKTHHKESSFASRSMRLTGPLLLAFIIFHILHLTTGTVHPDYHEGDVYHNLIGGLSVVWVGGVYLLAMAMLGFHLWHGVWSLFQTLGGNQPRYGSLGRQVRDGVHRRRRPGIRRGPPGGPGPAGPLARRRSFDHRPYGHRPPERQERPPWN